MDPEAMRRCMSFGFSDKNSKLSIGQCMERDILSAIILLFSWISFIYYFLFDVLDGNGFKTSSMRLGGDAIVFSRHLNNRYVSKSEYNDMLVKAICFLLYWQKQSLLHIQEWLIFINYLHPEGNAYSDVFIYVLYTSNLGFLLIWSFEKGSKGGPLPGKRYTPSVSKYMSKSTTSHMPMHNFDR